MQPLADRNLKIIFQRVAVMVIVTLSTCSMFSISARLSKNPNLTWIWLIDVAGKEKSLRNKLALISRRILQYKMFIKIRIFYDKEIILDYL